MPEPHLVSTLTRHLSETEGRLSEYRRKLADARRDLVHLCGTIALFDHYARPDQPMVAMSFARMFKRGEVFQICCNALAEHPTGLDTSELALVCLKARRLDESDKLLRRSMAQNIIQIMTGRRERGEVVSSEKRGATRVWRLPIAALKSRTIDPIRCG